MATGEWRTKLGSRSGLRAESCKFNRFLDRPCFRRRRIRAIMELLVMVFSPFGVQWRRFNPIVPQREHLVKKT